MRNRSPLIALMVMAGLGCLIGDAQAELGKKSPLDELQDALREVIPYPSPFGATEAEKKKRAKERDDLLNYRKTKLQKYADQLQSLGALRRALLLSDWKLDATEPKEAEVDKAVLDSIAKRFKEEFRKVMAEGGPAQKAAALNLLGDLSQTNQSANKGKTGYLEDLVGGLVDDVIKVIQDSSAPDPVRAQAILAFGNLYPDVKKIDSTLAPFVQGPCAPALLEAALKAAGNLIENATTKAQGRNARIKDRQNLLAINESALPLLLKGLKSTDSLKARQAAIEGLGLLTDSLSIYRPLLGGKYPPVGRPRSEDEQKEIQRDYDAIVQEEKSLEKLTEILQLHIAPLGTAIHDHDAKVRTGALDVLEDFAVLLDRLNQQRENLPLVDPKKAPNPEPHATRKKLGGALHSVLPSLTGVLSQGCGPDRVKALQVIFFLGRSAEHLASAVVKALHDPIQFVRWAAARAIGRISSPQKPAPGAIEGLARLLTDVDVDVRGAAARALTCFDPIPAVTQHAVPVLSKVIADANRDAEIKLEFMLTLEKYGVAGKGAIPGLIQALQDESDEVRARAAELLGNLGPLAAEAIPALKAAQHDKVEAVRLAADDALLSVSR